MNSVDQIRCRTSKLNLKYIVEIMLCVIVLLHSSPCLSLSLCLFTVLFLCFYCSMGPVPEIKID